MLIMTVFQRMRLKNDASTPMKFLMLTIRGSVARPRVYSEHREMLFRSRKLQSSPFFTPNIVQEYDFSVEKQVIAVLH
jgi:hypothetical protein